jgi:hypothetical protein
MRCADYNLPLCYECDVDEKKQPIIWYNGHCVLGDIKTELDDASDDEDVLKFVIKNYIIFHDGLLARHLQKIVELFYPQYTNLVKITMLLK